MTWNSLYNGYIFITVIIYKGGKVLKSKKIFCGGILLDTEELIESGIKYPIELSYYKTINNRNSFINE